MLIFHYVALAVAALGVVVVVAGLYVGLKFLRLVRVPPRSEDDETKRADTMHIAVALLIVGGLLLGVGFLFR